MRERDGKARGGGKGENVWMERWESIVGRQESDVRKKKEAREKGKEGESIEIRNQGESKVCVRQR